MPPKEAKKALNIDSNTILKKELVVEAVKLGNDENRS